MDDGGDVKGGPHHIAPVPVIEGIRSLAVAAAGGLPVGVSVADTGVGEARAAANEEGELGLLLQAGLLEVGCAWLRCRSEQVAWCFRGLRK